MSPVGGKLVRRAIAHLRGGTAIRSSATRSETFTSRRKVWICVDRSLNQRCTRTVSRGGGGTPSGRTGASASAAAATIRDRPERPQRLDYADRRFCRFFTR